VTWKNALDRVSEMLRVFEGRRASARSRGYSGPLYTYIPGKRQLKSILRKLGEGQLASRIEKYDSALTTVQKIYDNPTTPVWVKQEIDRLANVYSVRVGRYWSRVEEQRRKRAESIRKRIKKGLVVRTRGPEKSLYGIVESVGAETAQITMFLSKVYWLGDYFPESGNIVEVELWNLSIPKNQRQIKDMGIKKLKEEMARSYMHGPSYTARLGRLIKKLGG